MLREGKKRIIVNAQFQPKKVAKRQKQTRVKMGKVKIFGNINPTESIKILIINSLITAERHSNRFQKIPSQGQP